MDDPELTLVDIALLVGFAEQSAFNRAAKRWFGMTPSEYRARK
jgi:AraC-like DNA-binding protein